jgi:hypothetical protein
MLLILLEVKCCPPFHLWNSYDRPEVCPYKDKLPFLQITNCSGKGIQTFPATDYRFDVFKMPHIMLLFQFKTTIENP